MTWLSSRPASSTPSVGGYSPFPMSQTGGWTLGADAVKWNPWAQLTLWGHLNMKMSYGDKQEGGTWKHILCPCFVAHAENFFFPCSIIHHLCSCTFCFALLCRLTAHKAAHILLKLSTISTPILMVRVLGAACLQVT